MSLAIFKCLSLMIIFGIGFVGLSRILDSSGPLMRIVQDRNLFLEKQYQLYDDWGNQSLRMKHRFYLFNITNGDQFLRSDAPMTVDEVGPFVYDSLDSNQTVEYNLSSLSLEELRFNLNESDGDESVFIYALNVPLIRQLSEPNSSLPGKDLVRTAKVREVLREIVDGYGLGTSQVDEPLLANKVLREHPKDASSNYQQFLRNEVCLRLFRVIWFVNPPTSAKSGRFFQELPCDCLVVVPNGTESMHRADPKYAEVRTSKYVVRWDDEHCAEMSGNHSLPIRPDRYASERVFSVSTAAHWRNEAYVRFDNPKTENSSEIGRVKVEQFSDVVTDFSFEFQWNIPLKFGEKEQVNYYPVLRAVTSGVSKEDVDSSIYSFIAYPMVFIEILESNAEMSAIFFSVGLLIILLPPVWRRIRRRWGNAQQT